MKKAIFIDRDGVINEKPAEHNYVKTWAEFEFIPGIASALKKLANNGFSLIIVTNQRGIARRLLNESALADIHDKMIAELGRSGVAISSVYYCPHEEKEKCGCRKPQPGMILRGIIEHGIDPKKSYMIGDSASDIEAGKKAGYKTIFIGSTPVKGADYCAENIKKAAHIILGTAERPKNSCKAESRSIVCGKGAKKLAPAAGRAWQ